MKKLKFTITTTAYQQIVKTLGSKIPEQGGILIGKDGVITDFVHDEFAETSSSTYSLNISYLNPIIKKFKEEEKELLGIIHSHPYGCRKLSRQDQEYFAGVLNKAKDVDYLFTPIVFPAKQEEFHIFPYVFYKDGSVEEAELVIVPNNYDEFINKDEKAQKTEKPDPKVVEERKQLLVAIHQNISANSSAENERLLISRLVIILLLIWNLIVLMLGLSAIVLTAIYFIITKNLITF